MTKKNSKTFVGIDNGVTGSIGIIAYEETVFYETPVIKCLSYTKEPQHIHRIDYDRLFSIIHSVYINPSESVVLLERPMVNPKAFKATQSALRALEATIIAIEQAELDFLYIDSKEWQREFFSSSLIGHDDLKKASLEIGCELFPTHATQIRHHKDADGLLIAEYCRRRYGTV